MNSNNGRKRIKLAEGGCDRVKIQEENDNVGVGVVEYLHIPHPQH